MRKDTVSQYILTLFDESRNGELTVGSGQDRFDYPVKWDEQTAETLAARCGDLVVRLTELACHYNQRPNNSLPLSPEQQEVWNTYLRPFPDHGMDPDTLRKIWEKEAIGIPLTAGEQKLSKAYDRWYETQALGRLPWKGCAPTDLIRCARRYARLVQLNAPVELQEHEALWLAEEFVLYNCMNR